jgi:hypothetical protein
MEDEVRKEKEDEEFEKKREELKRKDDEKTEKNRKKREKKRAAKNKKDHANNGDIEMKADKPDRKDGGHAGADGEADQEKQQHPPNGAEAKDYEEPGVIIHEDD